MTDNRKPEIRFRGFTKTWEQRKLSNLAKITMGQSPNGANYTENPEDYILVQGNADMKNGRVIPRVWTTQITKTAEKGDFILSVRAPVGDVGKTDYNVVLGRGVAGIRGNEFIYQSLLKMKEDGYWRTLSTGSTFESINSSDIKNAEIMAPINSEQIKIGTYFNKLDNLITLHQRKCEKMGDIKKAMLEKMFPKNEDNFPEIRFRGFTKTWEQCKLETVVNVQSGRDYKHLNEGSIPVYGTGGYMLSVNDALSHEQDAIGIGRKGTINKPFILKAPFWTVDTLFYAVPKEKFDLGFIYGIFQKVDWKKKDESTGVPSLSKSTINAVSIMATEYNEQTKIGIFFKDLDNLINLHQRELEKLQNIKKSYLGKMFI